MPSKDKTYRLHAFKIQSGKCYYCEYPMWEQDLEQFASIHHLTKKQAKFFKSTAEHLIAQQDGGQSTGINIVAACLFCNLKRHQRKVPLAPIEYKRFVKRRLISLRWNTV
jgi:hypothetical protein